MSSSLWYGMQMIARSLIFRFSGRDGDALLAQRSSTSSNRCSRSMTMPVPSTLTVSSRRMPDGSRFRMNLPFSLMTVWPALFPP